MELKVSYPITFLKLLRVTDSTTSLSKVGETLSVIALVSSIGTTTGCELALFVLSTVCSILVLTSDFEDGAS